MLRIPAHEPACPVLCASFLLPSPAVRGLQRALGLPSNHCVTLYRSRLYGSRMVEGPVPAAIPRVILDLDGVYMCAVVCMFARWLWNFLSDTEK